MTQFLMWPLFAFLVLAMPVRAEPPEGYPFVTFDEGFRIAAEQDRRIFMYFGRYGCTWCDRTNREAFSDHEVRRIYTSSYVLVYVDTESGNRLHLPSGERITESELSARLKVLATPMFVFSEPGLKPLSKTSGVKNAQDLIEMHLYVAGDHFRTVTLRDFQDARRKDP
jgi:thioredoxin-related protein